MRPWIHGQGLSYQLSNVWDELETVRRLVPGVTGVEPYRQALRSLTQESNKQLFEIVEDSSRAFETGDWRAVDPDSIRTYCQAGIDRLVQLRNMFIAENIYRLRDAEKATTTAGPIIAPQLH